VFFFALCIIATIFRFLYFFLFYQAVVGIVVLTLFSMIHAVLLFILLVIMISLGFSSAFHLLFETDSDYVSFLPSLITTIVGIFTGYKLPDFNLLLLLPSDIIGYILEVFCVILGVIMLINFLIAVMNNLYDEHHKNSNEVYRGHKMFHISKYLVGVNTWPGPLVLIQGICILLLMIRNPIKLFKPRKKPPPVYRDKLYATIVREYFKDQDKKKKLIKKEEEAVE